MSDAGSRGATPEDDETSHRVAEAGNESDKDSDILSEIDEDQFDDLGEGPVEIDEDVAQTLKASKRKRAGGDAPQKPKEGRRAKKRPRDDAEDVEADGAPEEERRRPRKARSDGEGRLAKKSAPAPVEEAEEHLTPEERRRRAMERAMDAAIRGPTKRRRKKDEVDLEDQVDEQIASLKMRMEQACNADNAALENGQPAINKLKLLPEVNGLLSRSAFQDAVLDPETNFLQSVKFFLEPLENGSLPAYNIQRDLFTALTRLPVEKEVLLSSGIGKVVLFYTKSKKPEVSIKRMAERLVREWSRPILKRTDDYKKRFVETRDFDYDAAKLAQRKETAAGGSQFTLTQRPAGASRLDVERERLLAPVVKGNRAKPAGLPATYTVAPRSTYDGARGPDHRPIGASGIEAFRRMTQKGKGKK